MATLKYSGLNTLNELVAKVKTLVNAVQVSANTANTNAQTASTEATYHGTSTTTDSTIIKVITCPGFVPKVGAKITVHFSAAQTAATVKFKFAHESVTRDVYWAGMVTGLANAWSAQEVVLFAFDGTKFHLLKTQVTNSEIISIAKGGTGASTAAAALTNLGAAAANHTHTASAVGASPSNHTHAAADVGAAPATHYHTAADVGAAPASHNHDVANISGILPVAKGGTGANTTAGILSAIGGASATHSHTAAAVGASPSNHTHTAAAVGAAAATHNHSAANITSGTLSIARGGTGGATADAACAALGAAKRILYNASIPTGWTANSSGGFTKTVNISGILSTDVPIVGVVLSSDVAAAKLQGAAFACINRITTNNGSITLYAFNSAPTTAISIQLLVLR